MPRKLTLKGWIIKLEHLQRDKILKEYNYVCSVNGCTARANQVDHLFSRNHKALFFYPDNLNPICAGHNTQKGFGQGSVAAELFFKTRNRIGNKRWNQMIGLLRKPFPHFRKKWYLETVEKQLLTQP